MFVTVIILVAMLGLFDFSSKLTRVQTQVADMQQELRIGQYEVTHFLKMAGRGGLPSQIPGRSLPTGVAFEVKDNVASGVRIGDGTSPKVVEGTDVLTIRGTFITPIYDQLRRQRSVADAPGGRHCDDHPTPGERGGRFVTSPRSSPD